ncbi:MAG TPA: hypothetical protein VGI89_06780, partial [Rhizomicrobium sp.]
MALKMMTVRVSISITAWPKRLVDSVGVLMLEGFIGVFSEVAQPLCRRRKQPTLRALRSNRELRSSAATSDTAAAHIADRFDNRMRIIALNEMTAG